MANSVNLDDEIQLALQIESNSPQSQWAAALRRRLQEKNGNVPDATLAPCRTLVERARVFATAAHAAVQQLRKYTHEPYIVHPAAVVALLQAHVPEPPAELLAAAWLHDTVEDCHISPALIEREFGPGVAALVSQVTDVSRPNDGNRAIRKAIDCAHIAEASPDAQTLKLADLIDNSRSIVAHDPKFARVYLAEKVKLLAVLKRGNPTLLGVAARFTANLLDRCDGELVSEEMLQPDLCRMLAAAPSQRAQDVFQEASDASPKGFHIKPAEHPGGEEP